jgi:hypothetical protein
MCDTMVALGSATADGAVMFAKNCDREPGERVQCTCVDVPQVETTHATLLSRPFWRATFACTPARWIAAVEAEPVDFRLPTPYRLAWRRRNRKAGVENEK